MKFILSSDAGKPQLRLSGDDYKYVIKVRRHVVGDTIVFRNRMNLTEEYRYVLESTDGRHATFVLEVKAICLVNLPKDCTSGGVSLILKRLKKSFPCSQRWALQKSHLFSAIVLNAIFVLIMSALNGLWKVRLCSVDARHSSSLANRLR